MKRYGYKRRLIKNKKVRILLICLLVLFVVAAGVYGYIYIRLDSMSRDSVMIVKGEYALPSDEPVVETLSPDATPSVTDAIPDASPDAMLQEQNIYLKNKYSDGIINILIIGRDTDSQSDENGRSDAMVILSYNIEKRSATLISLMRDSLVPVEGYGWTRLNHTYAYGGVGLCINTINACLDLDIQNYVIVNFDEMIGLVDQIGGIEVPLTEDEAELYSWYYGWDTKPGMNHMTGDMALKHARLRALDSDFERTRRQRDVLEAIYNKVSQEKNILTLTGLVNSAIDKVQTNLPPAEILNLASNVVFGNKLNVTQARVPAENTWSYAVYNGMSIVKIDIAANAKYVHSLIYGE